MTEQKATGVGEPGKHGWPGAAVLGTLGEELSCSGYDVNGSVVWMVGWASQGWGKTHLLLLWIPPGRCSVTTTACRHCCSTSRPTA